MNNNSFNLNNIAIMEKKASGSITHAADVLVCLSNDIQTVTHIARQCSLGKSTVHRVLKLLERYGLVLKDTTNRRYYLGPLVTQLASNSSSTHEDLIIYAVEEMKHLSTLTEETVTLDILIGTKSFCLYEIPSKHDLKVTQETRMGGSMYAGASSKVLLSLLNNKQLKRALDVAVMAQTTERTVTNKELLIVQIKKISQQGYAISNGERIIGATCITAPVKNYVLPVALSVVGPESRLQPRAKEVIEELKSSATRISEKIAALYRNTG